MFTRALTLVAGLVLALVAVTAVPAAAQGQGRWIPYTSGFAGGSAIPTFAVNIADPATATTIDVQGRKLVNAGTFGGSIGLWKTPARGRLLFGLRGEVAHQRTDANQQLLPATGTLFGQPYSGPIPVPSADGSATLVVGTLLLGWQVGGNAASGVGRITPYAGIGAGIDHVAATFTGLGRATDSGPALQMMGGVALGLSHRVSAFAEYRYHRMTHEIVLGTQDTGFAVKPNHVVAGFTVRLF